MELPSRGYPVSEEAVTNWFIKRHGRAPAAEEVGTILNAMAERDSQVMIDTPVEES